MSNVHVCVRMHLQSITYTHARLTLANQFPHSHSHSMHSSFHMFLSVSSPSHSNTMMMSRCFYHFNCFCFLLSFAWMVTNMCIDWKTVYVHWRGHRFSVFRTACCNTNCVCSREKKPSIREEEKYTHKLFLFEKKLLLQKKMTFVIKFLNILIHYRPNTTKTN